MLDERARCGRLWHTSALHVRQLGPVAHLDPLNSLPICNGRGPRLRDASRTWLAVAGAYARDDEARAQGIDGSDLAAALVASDPFSSQHSRGVCAQLTGHDRSVLEQRVERLLQPLHAAPGMSTPTVLQLTLFLLVGIPGALSRWDAFTASRLSICCSRFPNHSLKTPATDI